MPLSDEPQTPSLTLGDYIGIYAIVLAVLGSSCSLNYCMSCILPGGTESYTLAVMITSIGLPLLIFFASFVVAFLNPRISEWLARSSIPFQVGNVFQLFMVMCPGKTASGFNGPSDLWLLMIYRWHFSRSWGAEIAFLIIGIGLLFLGAAFLMVLWMIAFEELDSTEISPQKKLEIEVETNGPPVE